MMNEIQTFIQNASVMEIVYWSVALLASLIFAIQAVMLFIGFDTDADFSGGDMDFDADGIQLVGIKTITCFLLGFGWAGVLFTPIVQSPILVGVIAVAVGLSFMLLIAFLLKQVMKLSRNNAFSTKQIIGKTAEVYLRIPGNKESGKITVSLNGSLHELLAFSSEEIPTGAKVVVTEAIDESSVMVEKI